MKAVCIKDWYDHTTIAPGIYCKRLRIYNVKQKPDSIYQIEDETVKSGETTFWAQIQKDDFDNYFRIIE